MTKKTAKGLESRVLAQIASDKDGWKAEDLKMFRFLRGVLNHINIAYIGTYPPQECGIATFTRDLSSAISKYTPFSEPIVVASGGEVDIEQYSKVVKLQINKQDAKSYLEAADFINSAPVNAVSLQHEYGIYGGNDGEYVLDMIARIKKPIVTTLHTVLFSPSPNQKRVVQEMAQKVDALVVMVKMGREMLINNYQVPPEKIVTIPHGVPNVHRVNSGSVKKALGISDRPVISTFGLINRGKGIEYAIQALPKVLEENPDALYLVLGETHPGVRNYEGESYRKELLQLVADLGLEKHVRFNNRYLTLDELIKYLCATDVYVTPYINRDQIVSGTLAYALGCGKAIVSTPYLYAEEVLSQGRGILVDFKEPDAMAKAANDILRDTAMREKMEARAYRYGRRAAWFNVAIDYLDLFHGLCPKVKPARTQAKPSVADTNHRRPSA